MEEKSFLRETRELGRRLFIQGRLERQEALSQFILQNALQSFAHKGFLEKTNRKGFWRVVDEDEPFRKWAEPLSNLMRQEILE